MKSIYKKTMLAGLLAVAALAPAEVGAFSYSLTPLKNIFATYATCAGNFFHGIFKEGCTWKECAGTCLFPGKCQAFDANKHQARFDKMINEYGFSLKPSESSTRRELKKMMGRGVAVDALGISKLTPLERAVNNLDFDMVKSLVEAGADVNKPVWLMGMTSYEIAEYLIQKSADINSKRPHRGESPIFHAIFDDRMDLVELFVKRGIDLTVRGSKGLRPVEYAKAYKHDKIYEYLKKVTPPIVVTPRSVGDIEWVGDDFLKEPCTVTEYGVKE